jgi:hypothetical protein
VWFTGRGPATAFVSPKSSGCGSIPSDHCAQLGSGLLNGISVGSFECDVSAWAKGPDAYLYLRSNAALPKIAWWGKYAALDNTYRTASAYLLAASTGIPSPDFVEAILLVVSDANTYNSPHTDSPVLVYTGKLP